MSLWTPEQVASLNAYQRCGYMHPFTCGSGRRTDAAHLDGEGLLVATPDGWICPYCDYRQTWAHDFMLDGSWRHLDPMPYFFSKAMSPFQLQRF